MIVAEEQPRPTTKALDRSSRVPAGAHRRGRRADVLRKAGYRPQLIVGDPERISAEVLRSGAQVVLPADADGHAAGLERIQDLGVGR